MSWFFKAGLSAVAVLFVMVLIPASALARYPDDNGHHYGQLSNPGHHYGQLKHQAAPPPTSNPAPKSQPATGGSTTVHPGTGGTPHGQTTTSETTGIGDLPITLPVQNTGAGQVEIGNAGAGIALDWLLLVPVLGLLAVWLLILGREVSRVRRRMPAEA